MGGGSGLLRGLQVGQVVVAGVEVVLRRRRLVHQPDLARLVALLREAVEVLLLARLEFRRAHRLRLLAGLLVAVDLCGVGGLQVARLVVASPAAYRPASRNAR